MPAALIKKTSTTPEEILNDLYSNTLPNGECMEWQGCLNSGGYPKMNFLGNPNQVVHRMVAAFKYESSLKDVLVRHTCDNRKCINPNHLLLGTHKDNHVDMVVRGRQFRIVTKDIVFKTKELLKSGFLTQKQIGEILGINRIMVSEIATGKINDEAKRTLYLKE